MKLNNIHEKRAFRIAVVLMVLALVMVGGARAATLTVDPNGGAAYTRIQDAINASNSGDTVEVLSGTYHETVLLNKQLILKGIDTGRGQPVIDGTEYCVNAYSCGINIEGGDGSIIEGFTVINPRSPQEYYGIYIRVFSNNLTIKNNNLSNNSIGIFILTEGHNITISNNNLSKNSIGISLYKLTYDDIIFNNTIFNNDVGISTYYSDNITFRGNIIISNKECGICLSGPMNTILSNNISGNGKGISIAVRSGGNTISSNIIVNNGQGVYTSESREIESNNMIYNNYFNNTINAAGNRNNTWNTTKIQGTNIIGGPYIGGNYWANPDGTGFSQTCLDKKGTNRDGICDSPYALDANNTDYLPLAQYDNKIPPQPAPELPTIALIGLSLLGLLLVAKKKN